MQDIVYFVKDSPTNEELRYSLRSLANFPHGRVWFYGGCPDGLKPDKHIYVKQDQENKWQNVNMMLRMVCSNTEVSKDFWLFNDDFFVMEKVEKPTNYHNGDLYKRIVQLEDKHGGITPYTRHTLHIPMLINREKAVECLTITESPMFRSLYGNYCKVKCPKMSDVKITSTEKEYKGGIYLSTEDNSFMGKVGDQIRSRFPNKCQYEV